MPYSYVDVNGCPPPAVDDGKNILNALNDNILRQLFRYLDDSGLYETSRTCKRFCRIAQTEFASRTAGAVFDCNGEDRIMWAYADLFQTFGDSMHSIDLLNSPIDDDMMMDMAILSCHNIYELRTTMLEVVEPPLAGQLRRLHLYWCRQKEDVYPDPERSEIINLTHTFPADAPLESLTVDDIWDRQLALPTVRLPHLHEVRLRGVRLPDQSQTGKFFELNPQLQTLTLNPCATSFPDMMDDALRHRPPMRTLIVYGDFRRLSVGSLRWLRQCPNLQTLKICSNYVSEEHIRNYYRLSQSYWLDKVHGLPFAEQYNGLHDDETDIFIMSCIARELKPQQELIFVSTQLTFAQIKGFLQDTADDNGGRPASAVLQINRPEKAIGPWLEQEAGMMDDIKELASQRNGRLTVVVRRISSFGMDKVSAVEGD